MNFFLAQVLGFIALFLSCEAVFKTKKNVFLVYEALVDIFYALSYLVLGVWGAGVISVLSMFAMLALFYFQKKKSKYTLLILLVFCILYIFCGTVFWQSWLDIIPIIATIFFTIGFYTKDLQFTRLCIALPNIIIIIYNVFCKTYTNALLDTIETVVVLIAIIKFYKEKSYQKC